VRPGLKPGAPGAVPGHAPTNPGGTPWALPPSPPGGIPHRFGQPEGNSGNSGRPATAQQRFCMEAIQRDEPMAKLLKRFPPGMVRRLMALQACAEDPSPDNQFFLQAQREIYKITVAPARKEDKEAEQRERAAAEIMELKIGRVEVPMPGAPGDVPPTTETKAG